MNVYDFDKTIYNGDSTIDFYLYCFKKNPLILIDLPKQIIFFLLFKFKICSKTKFKEVFYSFLKRFDNIDSILETFWDINQSKIKKFYLCIQENSDVIISASPYFLLQPICNRLDIKTLIASEVDKTTGKYTGLNCYGEEKVNRLKKVTSEKIDNFFSDSYSDTPLAKIANHAFIVKKDTINPWIFK